MFLEGKTLELMIAAIVALVVVGPKDLPVLLRRFGQFMARLRGMAAEFRASFDEMARQSELDELRKEVEALRKGQIADMAAALPHSELNQVAQDIHQSLSEVGVELHPPGTYDYSPPPPPVTIAAVEEAPKPKPKPRAKAAAAKAPAAKASSVKKTAPKPAARKPAAKPRARAAKP